MSAALDLSRSPRPEAAARARDVAPLIWEHAPRMEAAAGLTPEVLDALHERALFRCLLPKRFGGEELAPADYFRMVEVVSSADASTAWCVGQASGCSMAAAYLKPEISQEIWGKDPRAVLAWGMGQATAKVVDGGYIVNGRWNFASGSKHATIIGGHCKVEERDGTLRGAPNPIERTMLFRPNQAKWTSAWDVMGLAATGSDTYEVKDLFVPDDWTVCRDTDEERREAGTLYQFSTTHLYSTGFAGVALGIARGALEAFKELAKQKTPSNMNRALCDSPVIQSGVAQMEAKLRAGRAHVLMTLRDVWDEVAVTGRITMDQKVAIRLATTSSIHLGKEVVEFAYQEAGATAIFASHPFERRFRDMHCATQQVQARMAHFEVVGQHLLGMPVQARFL